MSFKSGATTAGPSKMTPPGVKEFTVKLARDIKKKYNVMQFNRGDKIDFSKGPKVVMDRENNLKEFRPDADEELPTKGAGSEYGRERREEARRKKYGIISKKYKPDDQPWVLRVAGKPEKKYRGKKEGLITENASYYLFTQQADGTFHAVPVDSWYVFHQSIKHSTLNAEEAEEEFNRRDRSFNYFSLMVQKRLKEKTEDETTTPEKGKKQVSKRKAEALTILEDDDYHDLMSSGDESDSSDEDKKDQKKKKTKKKGKRPARPQKKDSGSEAEEESDTGDFEGREFDYMSEVSSDEEAEEIKTDIKGLDEEMKTMEDEEEEEEESKAEGEEDKKKETEAETKEGEKPANKEMSSSSGGSDSEDSDIDDTKIQSSIFMQKKNAAKKTQSSQKSSSKSSSRGGSRPSTPITGGDNGGKSSTDNTLSSAAVQLESPNVPGGKRPGSIESPRPSKKPRTDSPVPSGSKTPTPEVGLTEDVVRRYLMRKPMTTKDLLYKLNPKKTGLSSEEVVKRVTMILRKLAPEKRRIKDKVYWHIKDDSKPAAR